MLKTRTIFLIAFALLAITATAQENTQSPYSMLGLGLNSKPAFDMNKAMGGTGIGLRSSNKINMLNPASLTSQDSMSFIFDVGLSGTFSNYATNKGKQNYSTGNLDHIALGFPVTKWWKMAVGATPFTNVGYSINEDDLNANAGKIHYQYRGNGNLTTMFIGSGFNITENLSLGATAKYYFGNIEKSKSVIFEDSSYDTYINTSSYTLSDFSFEFGAQYTGGDKKLSYTLGATFSGNSDIAGKYTNFSRVERPITSSTPIDTIHYSKNNKFDYQIPLTLGFGGSVNFNQQLLLSADFTLSTKNAIPFNTATNIKSNDSWYLGLGAEYTPDRRAPKGIYKRINYRIGGFIEKTQYNINNTDLYEYGVSVGLGIPSKYSKTNYSISAQFGQFGTKTNNNIAEQFARVSFCINFYDIWFVKRKYD